MSKPKVQTKYDSSDIAEIIKDLFSNLESPEGVRFKCVHILNDVVMVNINQKTFIINISVKESLS